MDGEVKHDFGRTPWGYVHRKYRVGAWCEIEAGVNLNLKMKQAARLIFFKEILRISNGI